MADRERRILYASRHYPGRIHDKAVLENESRKSKLPQRIQKLFDLAFLGLESEYENVIMPKKKPKGRELTERQKNSNKNISRVRVKIENAFAGVKRLRIVYHVSRAKRDHFIDQTFIVACGLWNYYLATK